MLSKGRKIRYLCGNCKSKHIYRTKDEHQNLYLCRSCGYWAAWRSRLKEKHNGE